MRGRGDNNRDEAADNKQIRFGSKIYLISFYWPKSKAVRQTERKRESARVGYRRTDISGRQAKTRESR